MFSKPVKNDEKKQILCIGKCRHHGMDILYAIRRFCNIWAENAQETKTFHEHSCSCVRVKPTGCYLLIHPFQIVTSIFDEKRSFHSAREAMVGVTNEVIMEACLNMLMFPPRYLIGWEKGTTFWKLRGVLRNIAPPDSIPGVLHSPPWNRTMTLSNSLPRSVMTSADHLEKPCVLRKFQAVAWYSGSTEKSSRQPLRMLYNNYI